MEWRQRAGGGSSGDEVHIVAAAADAQMPRHVTSSLVVRQPTRQGRRNLRVFVEVHCAEVWASLCT